MAEWISKKDFYEWRKQLMVYVYAAMIACFICGFVVCVILVRNKHILTCIN